ncbi:hypothetical protein HYC85_026307 [Camellia sinensis]|uniref:Leucine-rich repeat-containing N-terminal plant-type domain-containing protein n=1 Tax=Camellia sinensis TaxID=4442 RepID=A0A7J7G6W6_CAMSI|nr:hypothetical protein HYC85_026307 [Camellia sinensis]
MPTVEGDRCPLRFIGPFEILERIGEVAYRLALPPQVSEVHDVFHICMLRKYEPDPSHVLDWTELEVDEDASYEERPVIVLDTRDQVLSVKLLGIGILRSSKTLCFRAVLARVALIALERWPSICKTTREQIILLRLKQHWYNPPSISHWTPPKFPDSNSSTHCNWPEITCTNDSVTGLSLPNKTIAVTIPQFICDLKNLTVIDFQYNYIPGPFPTVLYNCSKLKHLDLSLNFFIGRIPGDVDRLSTRLRVLNLNGNNFTGDIPLAIGRFHELRVLRLFQNELNGSFPPEIGNLSNLEMLELSDNAFLLMAIPSSFTQLRKLKQLWIKDSSLIGEIPVTIGNLTELEELDLSNNKLTGTIPSALKMQIIDLSQNNLNETIPADFGKLTMLSVLALFENQLSGEIPETISRLPSLRDVKLFNNNLSGTLPPDFGRYSKLRGFRNTLEPFHWQVARALVC